MRENTYNKLEKIDHNLNEFYNKDICYFNKIRKRKKEVYRAILASLEILGKKDMSILDVGCGTGNLMYLLHNKGYSDVEGIDRCNTFINEAKKKTRLNIYKEDIKEFNTKKRYDIIILADVLEHSINPDKVIEKCRYLLKKDGLILIQGPNLLQIVKEIYIKFHNIPLFVMKMLQYITNIKIKASYRTPTLNKNTYKEDDVDACYLINPYDLKYFLRNCNFNLIFCTTLYNPIKKQSSLKKRLIYLIDKIPIINYFGGSLLMIASKNNVVSNSIVKKLSRAIKEVY